MTIKVAFAVTEIGPHAVAGDYFTAIELGNALKDRFGWQIEFRALGDNWYDLSGIDLFIAMVDDYELPSIRNAKPDLLKVAWARNWFERWSFRSWIGDYDLLLGSSTKAVDFLSQQLKTRARLLRIATNTRRFAIGGREKPSSLDFVFTGSYWQSQRDMVDALSRLPKRFRGAIYGKHWEQVPSLAHLDRGFVPYEQIHEVYQQASIVIDDANHVTKDWGAANSRVFDALAAGCLVISNSQSVSDEVFDGLLPVYQTPANLERLLDDYLTNQAKRDQLQEQLQKLVLQRHSYKHRALEFSVYIRSLGKILPSSFDRAQVRPDSSTLMTEAIEETAVSHAKNTDNTPLISFIVPIFNNLAATQEMLSSLKSSLPPSLSHEIILADDASTDGVGAWLRSLTDSNVRVLHSDTNRGYAANNNAAAALARGKLLGLLNSDLVFRPGWFEPMLAVLESNALNAGLVGNLQYRIADGSLDHAGVELAPNAQLQHIASAPPRGVDCVKVFAVTGACMLMRKTDFDAIGGFDEAFVNGGEDIDLCFKVREKGKGIYLAANSRIYHHVSLSRQRNSVADLRNSRRLFSRWRKELKQELSNRWYSLLQKDPAAYSEYGFGDLNHAFLASRRLASLTLAESMLRREEIEWSQRLDSDCIGTVSSKNLKLRGLVWSPEHKAYILSKEAEIVTIGLDRVVDFILCGKRVGGLTADAKVTIEVNKIQTFERTLGKKDGVNVGVVNPIVLAGFTNRFIARANTEILVTHLVINQTVIFLNSH